MTRLRHCLPWLVLLGATLGHAQQSPAPAASGAPATRAIPFKDTSDLGDVIWRVGWVLLGLGVVAGGLTLVYRRMPGVRLPSARRLKVVETVRLAPRSTLFLVEMDRKPLLLGLHGNALQLLVEPSTQTHRVSPPADVEDAP